jgi:Crinkler effector protein N-terminal domain
MSLPLEINCLVLGDDLRHAFPVKIAPTESVGTLKELIKDKNKPTFDHVPAYALEVYHLSFLVDDDKLNRFQPEHEGDRHLSLPMKRLKGIFGVPAEDHIHVLVERPHLGDFLSHFLTVAFRAFHAASSPTPSSVYRNLRINCITHGDDDSHVFTTEIDPTHNVSALKKAIKEDEKRAFQDVDADTLRIFKVSLPMDDVLDATLQSLQLRHDPPNGVHHLSTPTKPLKGIFADARDEYIHVVVQRPTAGKLFFERFDVHHSS